MLANNLTKLQSFKCITRRSSMLQMEISRLAEDSFKRIVKEPWVRACTILASTSKPLQIRTIVLAASMAMEETCKCSTATATPAYLRLWITSAPAEKAQATARVRTCKDSIDLRSWFERWIILPMELVFAVTTCSLQALKTWDSTTTGATTTATSSSPTTISPILTRQTLIRNRATIPRVRQAHRMAARRPSLIATPTVSLSGSTS